MTRSESDPFALLAAAANLTDQEWFGAMDAALRRFDPDNPAPLISLLESDSEIAQRRGLHLFGVLGRRAFVALDSALAAVGHPSVHARSGLMDGVLSYSRQLRPDQASRILPLVTDKEPIVRERAIAFIACAELETLQDAIALIGDPQGHDHVEGFQYLVKRPENIQALFDGAVLRVDVRSGYALASIERLAREGVVTSPPDYDGDGYVSRGVIHLMKMWISRRKANETGPDT